ncbi:MAG: RnfABCDGE type electron transport complex subunit B [Lachnospiraceae bacterium]|nr:RnfABCDGE type electron transport complex subunit B [Lachnospiraceae bacterium]
MDINAIIIAAAIVAGLGLLIGILLGIVGKVFEVQVDEKEVAIREVLPGNNCGGCGFAGCDALAAAIAKGEAKPGSCPVGGAAVAAQIAEITGGSAEIERKVAFVKCAGINEKTTDKYIYSGNMNCREAANLVSGGAKGCANGCLGYGSCVQVCEFGGISIRNGVAFIDRESCKGCGHCVEICPRGVIELVPYEATVRVRCNSTSKGKDVKAVCQVGCIGCGLCMKNCASEAITLENNLAHIDYSKRIGCGVCVEKCPVKIIKMEA